MRLGCTGMFLALRPQPPPLIPMCNACLNSYQLPTLSKCNAPSLFRSFMAHFGPIYMLPLLNVLFPQLYYTFLKYKESISSLSYTPIVLITELHIK